MGIWEWVTAVLAIWGAVSILGAVFWALAGRKIFRPRPVQPVESVNAVITELQRRDRLNGGM